MTVLAVTGLNREARLVAGPGVMTLASGGDIATLAARIEAALTPEIKGIISIGIAGALDPTLKVGASVIGTRICHSSLTGRARRMKTTPVQDLGDGAPKSNGGVAPTSALFSDQEYEPVDQDWAARLAAHLPNAPFGAIYASGQMIVAAASKARLHQSTGALCVDMESHVAAAVAKRYDLPFVALRVISDGAHRALPKAARIGMKPDGGMDIAAVLKSIAADLRQLPALIRTGLEAEKAFKALAAARRTLGDRLAF